MRIFACGLDERKAMLVDDLSSCLLTLQQGLMPESCSPLTNKILGLVLSTDQSRALNVLQRVLFALEQTHGHLHLIITKLMQTQLSLKPLVHFWSDHLSSACQDRIVRPYLFVVHPFLLSTYQSREHLSLSYNALKLTLTTLTLAAWMKRSSGANMMRQRPR